MGNRAEAILSTEDVYLAMQTMPCCGKNKSNK